MSLTVAESTVDPGTLRRIEAFLFAEADLIDEQRYHEWFELFADPCLYWIPLGAPDHNPSLSPAIAYSDRAHVLERVQRMTDGVSFCQTPPSQTHHLIGNVTARPTTPDELAARWHLPASLRAGFDATESALWLVRSKQVLTELHFGRETTFASTNTHVLTEHGGTYRIAIKKLDLLTMNEPIFDLTFLL